MSKKPEMTTQEIYDELKDVKDTIDNAMNAHVQSSGPSKITRQFTPDEQKRGRETPAIRATPREPKYVPPPVENKAMSPSSRYYLDQIASLKRQAAKEGISLTEISNEENTRCWVRDGEGKLFSLALPLSLFVNPHEEAGN